MNDINMNQNIVIVGKQVWVNGKKLPPCPSKREGYNSTSIRNKIYIDGYEFKNGKWKKTLKAFWHLWF